MLIHEQATKPSSGSWKLEDEQLLCSLEATIWQKERRGWKRVRGAQWEAERMLRWQFWFSSPLQPTHCRRILSNFLLHPMPPRTLCHKPWFEMLLVAPASEISFAGKSAQSAHSADMSGFHQFEAVGLEDGKVVSMEEFKGKVVLVQNTATLWGTTTRDFTQMNELCAKVKEFFAKQYLVSFFLPVPWDPGSSRFPLQPVWRPGELWERRDHESARACAPWRGV